MASQMKVINDLRHKTETGVIEWEPSTLWTDPETWQQHALAFKAQHEGKWYSMRHWNIAVIEPGVSVKWLLEDDPTEGEDVTAIGNLFDYLYGLNGFPKEDSSDGVIWEPCPAIKSSFALDS